MFGIDWAIKKDLEIYDVKKDKLKTIENNIPTLKKFLSHLKNHASFYLEEGGGDSIKLLLKKQGHRVFTIPGKQVKDARDQFNLPKNDKTDARTIGFLAKYQPDLFYEFKELDELTSRIILLFKGREKTEKNLVQEKNRLFALSNQIELLELDDKNKILERQQDLIDSLEKQFETQTKLLEKEVKKHLLWQSYLDDIKGVGPAIAGGIIAGLKRASRFDGRNSIRHYFGMVKKKGDQNFNHWAKKALYHFADGVIRAKDKKWYELYKNIKEYYSNKHSDWKKGKVDNFARKFIETKFIEECWKKLGELES